MLRRDFLRNGLGTSLAVSLHPSLTLADPTSAASSKRMILDMVHTNPGEAPPETEFLNPAHLAAWGYTGQVFMSVIEGVPTFDSVAKGLLPAGSPERAWAEKTAAHLQQQVELAHAAGIKAYAWMQMAVFPRAVVARFHDEICDSQNRIDVTRPKTRELLAAQLTEIFDRLPGLDGLIIRTGEIYMHDLPFHASSGDLKDDTLTQAGTSIIAGAASHKALLEVLRETACVGRGKDIFYRTWDFGNNFHTNPTFYLSVTDAIATHPHLYFSIKHQKGDFHQLTPFNPTLMIGRHRQIIEVQCQREAYGKGAHPYYIGQGVIEGWEDMAWVNPPGAPKGLEDVIQNPLCAGIWTWSRGGGWDGPYIKDEFWCAQNAWVISQYARDPHQSEETIFRAWTKQAGLRPADYDNFRNLNLLSTKAVLRGQLTTLKAKIDVWWARDDNLTAPDLTDFVKKGLVEASIAEKQQAVAMWVQIQTLAASVHFQSSEREAFVRSSCRYGFMRYSIIAAGWTALVLARAGELSGQTDKPRIAAAIAHYDALRTQWKQIAATDPLCSTLMLDIGRGDRTGIGVVLDRLRKG